MYRITKIIMVLLLVIQTFSVGLSPVGAWTDLSKNKIVYSKIVGKYDDSNIDGSPQMKLAEATSSQQVLIDKNVIFTGQQTNVTITVSADLPLSKVFVQYVSHGVILASGYTDNKGRFTCSLSPQYGGNILVRVNGTEYGCLLVALGEYDSLLEATANDISGNPLAYFRLHASGEDWTQASEAYQGVARVVLRPGMSVVKLTGNDINNHGYYLLNKFTLAPREIRKVHINPIADSVQVNAQFTLDGSPLAHCNMIAENTSYPFFKEMDQFVGSTDSLGRRTLHVTPSNYKLKINGNSVNGMLYLTGKEVSIQKSKTIQIPWTSNNTGKLRMKISTPDENFSIKSILIDGKWMSIRNNNNVILSSGDYRLDSISLSHTLDGELLWYDIGKPWGQQETIHVTSGSSIEFNLDVALNSISLQTGSYAAVPGEPLWIWADVRTKSGYLLRGINETYKQMNLRITKPDGTSFTTSGSFDYIMAPGEIFDQRGTYTLEATGNLGPYYGAFSVSSTYRVEGTSMVDIAVNNPVVAAGRNNEVTITLTQEGKPLANKPISLQGWYGFYGQGVTDENGKFKATFHPKRAEEISIVVDGMVYSDFLFATDSEYGVVEVTVTDRESVPIENFWCSTRSSWRQNGGESYKGVKRLLAYKGVNCLALSGSGSNGESYYLTQNIYVGPGKINQLHLDTSSTKEVKLIFTYNDTPLSQVPVLLERTDTKGENRISSLVGSTDFSGSITIYVNQGVYTAYIDRDDPNRQFFNLHRENLQLGFPESSTVNCRWSSKDTGKLHLITNAPVKEDFGVFFSMGERGFRVRRNNDIILNAGTYPVVSLNMEAVDQDGRRLVYDYWKPKQPENIIIEPNVVTEYNFDITEKNISMNVFSSVYSPGNEVRFAIDVETLSGHLLNWYSNVKTNITVRKPNGEKLKYSTNGLQSNSFMLDRDDPAGRYEIQADVDLGPWYGGIRTVTGYFDIPEKITVSTSNPIVKCSEPTTVELNLSQNGSPVAGEAVALRLADKTLAQGKTNEQGRFSARVMLTDIQWDREIVVLVRGKEYRGLLYAIMPGEGLVEVTAKEINSKSILEFSVEFSDNYNNWGRPTETGVVREIVREGECTIHLASHPVGGGEIYYIIKKVNVTAGKLNRVVMDGSKTVTADITFKYDGGSIPNSQFLLQPLTTDRILAPMVLLGIDKQGYIKVHMTPGLYKAGVKSVNHNGRNLLLLSSSTEIYTDRVLNIGFKLGDTGIFKTNINDSVVGRTDIILDEVLLDLPIGGEAVVNYGVHDVSWVCAYDRDANGDFVQSYSFTTPESSRRFEVLPEETAVYDFSMKIKEFKLEVRTKEIHPGSLVEFGIEGVTDTGHKLEGLSGRVSMDMQIIKPNGEVINSQQFFRYGFYQLSPKDPTGVYTIKAKMDMGTRYGLVELTTTFNYTNSPYIIEMDPPNGSVDVPVDTVIHLKFNTNVNDALKGINNGKPEISIRDSNGGNVSFKYHFKGNTLTIIPDKALKEDMVYMLYIPSTSISDGAGNTMAIDFFTCFKTQTKTR